jgi:excinuclease ABC subunit A
MADRLIIRGAREHNLRDVNLDLPRDAMIVFTGLSGSGKSSLAFDTIFAEGQRRYVESLSAYARQFLGQMDKPDVDFIEGLSPAVSIDQKSTSRNPRSTVGTITEVYDYLRLLFARAGEPHCPTCGAAISRQTPQQIVDRVLAMAEGTRFQVLAPVIRGRKGEYLDLFAELQSKGYARARIDGVVFPLTEVPKLKKQEKHTIEVVIDRLAVKASARQRLTDSVETALGLASGIVVLEFVDLPEDDEQRERRFSEHLACPNDHPLAVEDLEPRSFSFNAPYGACPECTGLGTKKEVDADLLVPDPERTLREGAIQPWSGGQTLEYFLRLLEALGEQEGFDLDTPWRAISSRAQRKILHGGAEQVHVRYRNRYGRERSYYAGYEGVVPWLERRHSDTESEWSREKYEGYMRDVPCPACGGARLKPEILAVTISGRNIAEMCALSVGECHDLIDSLVLDDRQRMIAERVLKEINARLRFLVDVGLDYLSLDRPAGTLSGGEAQRIRLATQIGSGLVGVLYVLDEPSIGLHQRDNHRLIETLVRLKNLGNTLIVVEHDEDTIRTADWVVDIGPGAGEQGGQVVHSGPVQGLLRNTESLTGAYLAGRRAIPLPKRRRPQDGRELVVHGAREHNLRNLTVGFPLGQFVAVTGVSGSGKSTLVNDILYSVLANQLNGARLVPGRHTRISGLSEVDKVVGVDQSPIGRTPRSNPATYTGVFDHVRRLFAETTEAKVRGYGPGRFSFNVKGGRCENCAGDGTIKIEMNFLPDVYVPCEVCKGARYNRDTLEVHYKGRNIAEVLDMPIVEGAEFFHAIPGISRFLDTLVDVGLGYVRLGQPAPTLSGGEAQRVKLASELQKRSTGRTVYVLDEPTTGLHFEDIRKLLLVLESLVDRGNTVIVIEHNLDVVKTADWVIDMGPDGGHRGGMVVAIGSPEELADTDASYTGEWLRHALGLKGAAPNGAPGHAALARAAQANSGSAKTNGAAAGSAKSNGTATGTAKANGTAAGSGKSNGTAAGSAKTNGTAAGLAKTNGTAAGSARPTGTATGSARSAGAATRSARSNGTTPAQSVAAPATTRGARKATARA